MLSEGYTKEQIRNIFLEKYGPTVLISPPFSGFNILAWTLPFVAIAAAGYFIYKYIKDREAKRAKLAANNKPQKREEEIEDEILSASIEEEMKKYR
ncbi:hypothetical protein BHF68_11505 [Desulfuribacillus alkaliarsenatis]|uniref:Cytochrome c-type biogenesis protein n=1 Tax=Desulfuribacillus alkaliarsenatis TaxID=766136 RepID=A0A1E5FYS7_9FIRM|nr:hypothetical protein BHF68_11505 [Desulfuribacillus alkaliarsenatis]